MFFIRVSLIFILPVLFCNDKVESYWEIALPRSGLSLLMEVAWSL